MGKFKSIVIVYWVLVVVGVAGGFLMLTGWSYPIKHVSKPLAECKSVHWDQMPEGCIIEIPKIVKNDVEKYKSNDLYRLIYSNLWGGSYDNGWDVLSGGSPGMDIVSSKGTAVFAMEGGEIVQASYKRGIGNSITIKHKYKNGYIYSSYSHLDEMFVKVGDKVKEGDLIGKVGNTGTTYGQYGNHLDFQVTTTTQFFYPYSYHDCSVGLSYYDMVNSSLCRAFMQANTMDPIALIEGNRPSIASSHGSSSIVSDLANLISNTKKDTALDDSKKPEEIHNAAPVTMPSSSSTTTTLVQKYQYQVVGLDAQETIQLKKKFVFFIRVSDADTNALYHGNLAHRIVLRDTNGMIAFSTPVVTQVQDGIIKITALGLKAGYTDLKVEVAGKTLGSYGVTLQ